MRQILTRNVNAPVPGTYDTSGPTSGIRPLGTNQNIYQYDSSGMYKQNQLVTNVNIHAKKATLFGYYSLSCANGNTSGYGAFPSNQYDINLDDGRTAYDVRHRASFGGSITLPHGFRVSPFISIASGAPFNIVVGEDLNGDTQFNDRPAFATDLTRPSVIKTRLGPFDTRPVPGQKIILINYGSGPGRFTASLHLAKTFAFGSEKSTRNNHNNKDTNTSPGKEGTSRRYSLTFEASAQNVLNRVNLGQPIGTLTPPLFGKFNALAGSSTANRIINLQMQFSF
jgi:hypothetical protein